MHIPEKAFNTLTDEQKRKVEAAKTPEELLAIAKEGGYELTMEEINQGIRRSSRMSFLHA